MVGFPFTVPRTLLSNLAGEGAAEEDEESVADPLSLAAVVAILAVTVGSLDEREEEKSTDGRQVELDVDAVAVPLEGPFK